jgi:L-lactate dehydrogenase complex protein LldF
VYSGPIGAIITPQFAGIQQDPWLPFASSLCGACAEVCPVKIDIPRILLELRHEVVEAKTRDGQNRWEKLAFRLFSWVMQRPRLYEMAGLAARALVPDPEPGEDGARWIRTLPGFLARTPAGAWVSERDLPPPAPRSFRQIWRERRSTEQNATR